MAVASLGPYGGVQNLMLMPMRNDQNADTLVAMLGSCTPHMTLQQVSRSMGMGMGMEEVGSVGGVGMGAQKRPYYMASGGEGMASVEEGGEGGEEGDEGGDDFCQGHVESKKRRLSFNQVRSLERNFEVENKLEPERKMQLAKELGLQPRQVAVWFQNRRARWKIKQLERDFEALTQDYHRLQHDMDAVTRDKLALQAQVNRLKGIAPTEDEPKPVESPQCGSDHPDSPALSERSNIDDFPRTSPSPRASPTMDANPAAAAKDVAAPGVNRTRSSDSINSSDVTDQADSPCTSDSDRAQCGMQSEIALEPWQAHPVPEDCSGPWVQYPGFPPESFVGPNLMPDLCSADDQADLASQAVLQAQHRGAGVKMEDMDHAFLLSRLDDQPLLPTWWPDWA